jgi:alpha-L-fucosidase
MNLILHPCTVGRCGLACLLLLVAAGTSRAADPAPSDPNLDWWREARFGMFVHWGPVSLRGTEIGWSRGDQVPVEEYDALYREFNPTKFDADAWARTAKAAGARYLVFTSKHHDGFCMWDTRLTDYNIMHTPFGRDMMRELAVACRKQGVAFCTYHSICDWRHPDYPLGSPGGKTTKPSPDMDRYTAYLKGQLAEIIRGYGPIGILWFDGEWEKPWTQERGKDLYQFCHRLQDTLIINNRVAGGRQGMGGLTAPGIFAGDYDTPEQEVGKFQDQRPWESCITICQQWAWKPDDKLKSLKECVQTLVTCAGGDGNLLLNVGPMPSGEIEPRQVTRLKEIGRWLKRHGESIYGTRGGPWKPGPWGVSTRRGRTVYVHILDWRGQDTVQLPPLQGSIARSSLLAGGRPHVLQSQSGVDIRVDPKHRQDIDTVVKLELAPEASR